MESRVNNIIRDQDLLPKMKELGLFYILFGAESGVNADLKYFGKEQTVDEVRHAMRILKRNEIDPEDEKAVEKFFKAQGVMKMLLKMDENPEIHEIVRETVEKIPL